MNRIAEAYVKLVLALGRHDPDYVDAYYGPEAWRSEAQARAAPLARIKNTAAALAGRLAALKKAPGEMRRLRHRHLAGMIEALAARADILSGARYSFDRESEALYGAAAPHRTDRYFQGVREKLSRELPGSGPLVERYEASRESFVIPPKRLERVFTAAIGQALRRTREHLKLPEGESFRVEYVTGKPWSAYNWYQGNFASLIQVNTDLPIHIDRAIDLACHEGYPGHHVHHALCEKDLVRGRGWVEFSVYPLFSPQSLIAEGSANFGIEVAFTEKERCAFEREVLFPLAGLDPGAAGKYERVRRLADRLAYARNEAARRYLDGQIDTRAAVEWLAQNAVTPRPRAEQRVRFFDRYRSYVINYNLGKDLVRRYIESRGGTRGRPEKRWEEFVKLLSSPMLPKDLRERT